MENEDGAVDTAGLVTFLVDDLEKKFIPCCKIGLRPLRIVGDGEGWD